MSTHYSAPMTCPKCECARTVQIGGNADGSHVEGWDYACGSFWLRNTPNGFYHSPGCKRAAAARRTAALTPHFPTPFAQA